jgi:hypothetical protein
MLTKSVIIVQLSFSTPLLCMGIEADVMNFQNGRRGMGTLQATHLPFSWCEYAKSA